MAEAQGWQAGAHECVTHLLGLALRGGWLAEGPPPPALPLPAPLLPEFWLAEPPLPVRTRLPAGPLPDSGSAALAACAVSWSMNAERELCKQAKAGWASEHP